MSCLVPTVWYRTLLDQSELPYLELGGQSQAPRAAHLEVQRRVGQVRGVHDGLHDDVVEVLPDGRFCCSVIEM